MLSYEQVYEVSNVFKECFLEEADGRSNLDDPFSRRITTNDVSLYSS